MNKNKKLKLAIASDLHLEFGPIELNNDEGADVLILAGDICVASHFLGKPGYAVTLAKEYRQFFDHVTQQFPHVIFIMGNHEHYSGDVARTLNILREYLDYGNLHILEKSVWTYEGVTFIGGTLWTDMNGDDPHTLMYTRQAMNDFREVKNSNRMVVRQVPLYERNPLWTEDGRNGGQYKLDDTGAYIRIGYKSREEPGGWSPEDSADDHKRMLDYIDIVTRQPGRYVVVGHHAPSALSIAPRFQHDTLMNGAFHSKLDEFIKTHPQIELFVHGHMHNRSSYQIGTTRVECNPRGYIGHESIADLFKLVYIEI